MNVAGWIVIGAKLDTKELEDELKEEKRRLSQYEKEGINLKTAKDKKEDEIAEAKAGIYLLEKQIEESIKLAKSQEEIDAIQEDWAEKQELINAGFQAMDEELAEINNYIEANKNNISLTKNEIDETTRKLQKKDIKDFFKQQSKSLGQIIKKVRNYALAIIGIRGAYSAITRAMSTISSFDKQLKDDLTYIRVALASALEPIIRWIVSAIFEILKYIRYLIFYWTKYDIFKNANKNLDKMNNNAKKLQKTLTSFDEANIINKQQDKITPSQTFKEMTDEQNIAGIKNAKKWIEELLPLISGIVTAITLIKIGLSKIKALGIGVAVTGVVRAIEKIIDFIKEPTFENFIGTLEGISTAVMGIGIAFGNLPLAIAGAVALIIVELVKNYDDIIRIFDNILDWIHGPFTNKLTELFGPIGHIIVMPFEFAIGFIRGLFEGFYGGIKTWVEGVVKIFKGDFFNGIKDAFEGLISIVTAPLKALKDGINEIIKGLNKISIDIPDWVPMVGGKHWGINIPLIGEQRFTGGGAGTRFAKGGIAYNPIRMASGAVINRPNLGVPVGGESGPEGVIPLTQTQSMDLLGQAIARNVKINATIPVYMGNRQVAREMRTIMAEDDFAYNR